MGFSDWITRNMPGGYGSQARDCIAYFQKKVNSKSNYYHQRDWKEVFEDMVSTKGMGRMMTGNKSNSMIHVIISRNLLEETQGDLFQIVFYMVYFDNDTLYNETNPEILDVAINVIFDEVMKQYPHYVMNDINQFKIKFFSNRHNPANSQGGVLKKYEYLISQLTDHPEAKIAKVTRDQIFIEARNRYATTSFTITESTNQVRIDWAANMAMLGKQAHSWTFPSNYPQDQMLEKMMNDLEKKRSQMF